jgi:hypothetical protein
MLRKLVHRSARAVACAAVLIPLFAALPEASGTDSRSIVLTPKELPQGAKNVTLKIQRADGQPFTLEPNVELSVGIAFGTKLAMLATSADQPRSRRVLTALIKDLDALWSPAPRAGDELLVAVYINKRPVTAAASLRVAGHPGNARLEARRSNN